MSKVFIYKLIIIIFNFEQFVAVVATLKLFIGKFFRRDVRHWDYFKKV